MIHYMNLNNAPFLLIENGQKQIEMRLFDEKRKQISVGDTLVFKNASDESKSLFCTVKGLHIFGSFSELYASLPLDKCGYLPHEIPFASPKDMEIYYPAEKQKNYGVVGIEIELIK